MFIHSYKNISFRAMELDRKLPYRRLFPIHILLYDKHIIRNFQNFKCMGRLPLPPNPEVLARGCCLNFITTNLHMYDFIGYVCNA